MAFNDSTDGVNFTALSATPATFRLLGGRYAFGASATWGGGSLTLQVQMPDGSTYVAALPAFTADSVAAVDLPPGTYRLVIATATGVMGFVVRVPYRAA